jgi:DNA invertase Pin-like site-specific DNA recombinase
VLKACATGDVLGVWRLYRLGRSLEYAFAGLKAAKARGAHLGRKTYFGRRRGSHADAPGKSGLSYR